MPPAARSRRSDVDAVGRIGVAGGSGVPGKTTVVRRIMEALGDADVDGARARSLLSRPSGAAARRARRRSTTTTRTRWTPTCSSTHLRDAARRTARSTRRSTTSRCTRAKPSTDTDPPGTAIIVEGILIFTDPALRALMDVKVFVDTDGDTRFIRRLQRDVAERGRTVDSVIDQYLSPSSRCTWSSWSRASATPT